MEVVRENVACGSCWKNQIKWDDHRPYIIGLSAFEWRRATGQDRERTSATKLGSVREAFPHARVILWKAKENKSKKQKTKNPMTTGQWPLLYFRGYGLQVYITTTSSLAFQHLLLPRCSSPCVFFSFDGRLIILEIVEMNGEERREYSHLWECVWSRRTTTSTATLLPSWALLILAYSPSRALCSTHIHTIKH